MASSKEAAKKQNQGSVRDSISGLQLHFGILLSFGKKFNKSLDTKIDWVRNSLDKELSRER